MLSRPCLGIITAFVVFAACASRQPSVGERAPAIVASEWLNWNGAPPTLESCRGRVVLIEFWGTWCGPCVRVMPKVQNLHERYGDRGLTVLAISFEPGATMAPFLREHGYTMPVGADVEKETVAAYGIRSWPTTVVLDKDGKIIHVGWPADAEAAVEKALGLETEPGALLDQWLASQSNTDKAARRPAIERLAEKAMPNFDLRAWALARLPAESVASKPTLPEAATAPPVTDTAEAMRRCASAWDDQVQRPLWLRQFAETGPTAFDLATFATQAFAEAFPLDAAELKALVADKKYGMVLDAIMQRAPPAQVLIEAARDADLSSWCKNKITGARDLAKRGLMAQFWLFPDALPHDAAKNQQFWSEISASSVGTDSDGTSTILIGLGGEEIDRHRADRWVRTKLAHAVLMEDFADGKPPRCRDLPMLVDDGHAQIMRDLEARYGKPAPLVPN